MVGFGGEDVFGVILSFGFFGFFMDEGIFGLGLGVVNLDVIFEVLGGSSSGSGKFLFDLEEL